MYAALWKKISKTRDVSFFPKSAKALAWMMNESQRHGKYAVISDKTGLQTDLTVHYSDRCDWAFIPETFLTSGFGIALPKGSPYKDVFDQG